MYAAKRRACSGSSVAEWKTFFLNVHIFRQIAMSVHMQITNAICCDMIQIIQVL